MDKTIFTTRLRRTLFIDSLHKVTENSHILDNTSFSVHMFVIRMVFHHVLL